MNRPRAVLAIAILGSFVAFLDGSIVTVALPAIERDLGGGVSMQQWVVDSYLITLGALILVAGSLSDLLGRIRILRLGLLGFAVASVAIALAPTAGVLIGARLFQGAAGALLVPSSLALIMSTFRGPEQAKAIGTWTGATTGAFVVGPLLGGLLTDLASWRWAFGINVLPIAITILLLGRLGPSERRRPGTRVDLIGAALAAGGLGATVFALIEQPRLGWMHPAIIVTGTLGAVALIAMLIHESRTPAPMLPLSLFRIRNFAWGNAATWMIYGALALNGFILGVYLQTGAGLSATQAGMASLPVMLLMILGSSTVGRWAGHRGPRLFMTAGPAVMAVGSVMLLAVDAEFDYWTQVLPGVIVFGAGLTLTVAPLTSAILSPVGPDRAGIASAVNNAVARIAGLVAVAMLGSIVAGLLDLTGFHRATVVTAVLLAAGAAISWAGIRNDAAVQET
ncbi:MFS transporter [Demequina sp. SYSU T00039]|uniref:MFS transporter n=1 Tax=Demequina lignilytica TaxID=3051663 RepID=A0AAW7M906_9MICO|nr:MULTISPECIES: MFS transporter [unclassified Demequina]MDN4477333.1 MFS transporter [Demequina sp. SYSU T00039-1]MDN4487506.1 MFS transporter [Demequina sp. SYSU T00039]